MRTYQIGGFVVIAVDTAILAREARAGVAGRRHGFCGNEVRFGDERRFEGDWEE